MKNDRKAITLESFDILCFVWLWTLMKTSLTIHLDKKQTMSCDGGFPFPFTTDLFCRQSFYYTELHILSRRNNDSLLQSLLRHNLIVPLLFHRCSMNYTILRRHSSFHLVLITYLCFHGLDWNSWRKLKRMSILVVQALPCSMRQKMFLKWQQ